MREVLPPGSGQNHPRSGEREPRNSGSAAQPEGGALLFPSSDPCHLILIDPPPGFPSVWFGSGGRRAPPPHLPHHPPHPRGQLPSVRPSPHTKVSPDGHFQMKCRAQGSSLAVQWLGLHDSIAGGTGSIPV